MAKKKPSKELRSANNEYQKLKKAGLPIPNELKEKYNEYHRTYRKINAEKIKEYEKQDYQKNKEKHMEYNRRYKAKKKAKEEKKVEQP